MRQILSLAGWNWRLARRAYGILCAAFAAEQLAVLLWQASRPQMLGMGLAACYEEGMQLWVFLLVFLLAGLLAGPAVNDWKRSRCSYTWLTLPMSPAARLAAQVLTAAVLQLGWRRCRWCSTLFTFSRCRRWIPPGLSKNWAPPCPPRAFTSRCCSAIPSTGCCPGIPCSWPCWW